MASASLFLGDSIQPTSIGRLLLYPLAEHTCAHVRRHFEAPVRPVTRLAADGSVEMHLRLLWASLSLSMRGKCLPVCL